MQLKMERELAMVMPQIERSSDPGADVLISNKCKLNALTAPPPAALHIQISTSTQAHASGCLHGFITL